ncbi:cytochrome b/b6 domain-containing protein [Sphingomonas lutea]|uniref:Cytochrome b/b6 domain-containing protein n=2 Tax=Sphingomonas lutea TaxID=1045317 RepID=A0A7G9SLB7_9SPHN|nr:cytochrome b/b6 domain-containing protein [Sphingomonas lutea]
MLVALIAFSWWSAEDEEIEWHMWSGFAVLTLLLFRLLWGIFGSSTARFVNFIRGPRAVVAYLRDSKAWTAVGHSPLGALSVVALMGMLFLQVGTGLFNSDRDGLNEGPLVTWVSGDLADQIHDLHETLFDVLLVLIGLHVAAILFYRLVGGKKLLGPMITGRATLDPGPAPMRPGRWWAALLCLAAALLITRWIIAGLPPFSS